MTQPERRAKRSDDPVTALHYQLAHVRARARLDCVVLVDDCGSLLAGAGAWPSCEELAAYAPLLAHPAEIQWTDVGTRLAELARDVDVRTVRVDGSQVLLCSKGVGGREALDQAAKGCARILGA
jgi:hypothetical protein